VPERRKHPRFKLSDMAFAVCVSPPNIIGQIIDISPFGTAFSYIAEEALLNVKALKKTDTISIVDHGGTSV
jgi:hypothetical protein